MGIARALSGDAPMSRLDIDQILTRISLHDLISREAGVAFRRVGDRHVGLCPFHSEKTPSFVVFEGKRSTYHCFGASCGAHGDAITFLRRWKHLDVRDAIALAASLAGISPDMPPSRAVPERAMPAASPPVAYKPWPGQSIAPEIRLPEAGDSVLVFDPDSSRCTRSNVSLVHVYRNSAGEPLFLVLRFDTRRGKYFRQVEWRTEPVDGLPQVRGVWSQIRFAPEVLRPLYGVEDVGRWKLMRGRSILVVEGEKTRDAAVQIVPLNLSGMLTLTNLGSQGGIKRIDWQPLIEAIRSQPGQSPYAKLLLWPDADEAPESDTAVSIDRQVKFVQSWADSFCRAASAAGLRQDDVELWKIAPPADVTPGWDLADALNEGWTKSMVFDWCLENCSPV